MTDHVEFEALRAFTIAAFAAVERELLALPSVQERVFREHAARAVDAASAAAVGAGVSKSDADAIAVKLAADLALARQTVAS
jgi:hypothetical protein